MYSFEGFEECLYCPAGKMANNWSYDMMTETGEVPTSEAGDDTAPGTASTDCVECPVGKYVRERSEHTYLIYSRSPCSDQNTLLPCSLRLISSGPRVPFPPTLAPSFTHIYARSQVLYVALR